MGVHFRGERPGREQDGGRPGRPHGLCGTDGDIPGNLRKIWRPAGSGSFHGGQRPAVRGLLPVHCAGAQPSGGAAGVRDVRPVGGHYVAGDVQQGSSGPAPGWDGYVRADGPGGRPGLLRRAHPGGHGVQRPGGQPETRHFGGDRVSRAAAGGAGAQPGKENSGEMI